MDGKVVQVIVPAPELYTPKLLTLVTLAKPLGSASWTLTPVAVFGPALATVKVNRTVSPSL